MTSPIQDAAFDLVLLDPQHVRLFKTGGDALRATISDPQVGPERTYLVCQIARAFPLLEPDKYIGLRDEKDRDIGLLLSLDGLDADSHALAEAALARRYFLPRITGYKKVKKEFDTVTFDVETDKGPRLFVVQHLKESVQEVGRGRLLLTDRTGARYEIPDLSQASAEARDLLMRVLG